MKLSARTEHLSNPLFLSNLWTTLVIPIWQIFQLPWALAPSSSPLDLVVSPHFPSSATSFLLRPPPPGASWSQSRPPHLRIPPCWCQTLKRTTVHVCACVFMCTKGSGLVAGTIGPPTAFCSDALSPEPSSKLHGKTIKPSFKSLLHSFSSFLSLSFYLASSLHPTSPSLPLFQTIFTQAWVPAWIGNKFLNKYFHSVFHLRCLL